MKIPHTFITTFSGQRFDFTKFEPDTVRITDIAHSLAHLCRYNGHTQKFYSVAEHSCLIHDWVLQEYGSDHNPDHRSTIQQHARTALFHDAAEAYVGDMVKPLKPQFPDYHEYSLRLQQEICYVLRIGWPFPDIVKEADRRIQRDEIEKFWPQGTARTFDFKALGVLIEGWGPRVAEMEFIYRARQVMSPDAPW